jgi:hypothetical protein
MPRLSRVSAIALSALSSRPFNDNEGIHDGLSAPLRNTRSESAPLSETLIQKLSRKQGLLNSKDVIGIFGVHITTLQLWTKHQQIPYLKVGRAVRFDPAQLAHWLSKRQMGAHPRG